MSHKDDLSFAEVTVSGLISLTQMDPKIGWGTPVCVTGFLRVLKGCAFLSDSEQSAETLLISGSCLHNALDSESRRLKLFWKLYGGHVLYAGPATVWASGVGTLCVPQLSVLLLNPLRLRFASRSGAGELPSEPVEIKLPQPTATRSMIDVLGRGELSSLVRLEDGYSTSLLIEKAAWLAECFAEADVIHQRLYWLWKNAKDHGHLEDLVSKSHTLRNMLQMIFRDYERFCNDHDLPLPYGQSIADQERPCDDDR